MCKRNNRAQNEFKTELHHMIYIDYEENPLLWTVELCKRCHTRVDERRKARITQWHDRKRSQQYQQYKKDREQYFVKSS